MFRCKECKTLYKEKVDYCECGNNIFEEVPDAPVNPIKSYSEEEIEVVKKQPLLPVSWLSITIFSLCCIFSICFVLFLGPEPKKREKVPNTSEKTVVKDIPDIDQIWDDTPSYQVKTDPFADLNIYKNGLKNALMSEFDMTGLEGAGSCDIQFIINEHGKLKQKKLYQNTANKPLLNAAKRMLSAVKEYNPPPKSYNGVPLTLEVYGSGENYQLRYKN